VVIVKLHLLNNLTYLLTYLNIRAGDKSRHGVVTYCEKSSSCTVIRMASMALAMESSRGWTAAAINSTTD